MNYTPAPAVLQTAGAYFLQFEYQFYLYFPSAPPRGARRTGKIAVNPYICRSQSVMCGNKWFCFSVKNR